MTQTTDLIFSVVLDKISQQKIIIIKKILNVMLVHIVFFSLFTPHKSLFQCLSGEFVCMRVCEQS